MDDALRRSRPADDVDIALTAMTTFQAYVQQADTKVSTLIVVHAGADVAIMTAQTTLSTRPTPVALVACALFIVSAIASGYHLLQALRPRLHPPRTISRFGITGILADSPLDDASREAWEMARLFAGLAEVKYRHVARAIPWISAMMVIGVGTTLMISLTRG